MVVGSGRTSPWRTVANLDYVRDLLRAQTRVSRIPVNCDGSCDALTRLEE
jgi:hypothetical protein